MVQNDLKQQELMESPYPSIANSSSLPLKLGDRNLAVSDIQRRLSEIGIEVGESHGYFGIPTQEAIANFQSIRGLQVSGECNQQTWEALVEACQKLGERMLYRRTPMLRGDDVAQLQQTLSVYGFDPGRIDGIFGDETDLALRDFQHNCGLLSDGICGPKTIEELKRLRPLTGGTSLVTSLRERWKLISARETGLSERRIVVCEPGGFAKAASALKRSFGDLGSNVFTLPNLNPSSVAEQANQLCADLVISLYLEPTIEDCEIHFYRGYRYESEIGKKLAELMRQEISQTFHFQSVSGIGMATPILRETKMPAVELHLGNIGEVIPRVTDLANIIAKAVVRWTKEDWD